MTAPKQMPHWPDNIVWWQQPRSKPGQGQAIPAYNTPAPPQIPLMGHLSPQSAAEPTTTPAATPQLDQYALREYWSRLAIDAARARHFIEEH